MPNRDGTNGPRPTPRTGRNRNTVANNASRVPPPPVTPGSAISFGNQEATARYGYLAQLAALRANRAQIVNQFQGGLADARAQRQQGFVDTVDSNIERGLLGSSGDLKQREGVVGAFQSTKAGLLNDKVGGLLGLQQQRIGATVDYYRSLSDIASQRRVEQMAEAQKNFENDLYNSSQMSYGSAYRDALAYFRAQREGSAPRRRSGVQGVPYQGPSGNNGLYDRPSGGPT